MRPEEPVPGAPHDEGRDLQPGQIRLGRQQVAGAHGRDQALELAGRFRGAEHGFQPGAHEFLGQAGGDVLIAAAEDALAGPGHVAHHRGREAGEQAQAGEQVPGQQRLGRDVVVGLAVGQGQGVQPAGVPGREHLGDGAAGVVRDEVDAGQPERVAEAGDEAGQARQREVLVGRCGSLPVQRQVDGHAAALAVELADHVPPQVAAGAGAVDEQRRAARAAGVDVAGRTRPGVHLAPVALEVFQHGGHVFSPRCRVAGVQLAERPTGGLTLTNRRSVCQWRRGGR